METVIITLKHIKARKLLRDLEDMDLIEVIDDAYLQRKPDSKISDLKKSIATPMNEAVINQQLEQIRNEWQPNI